MDLKYFLNLFGQSISCNLEVEDNKLVISLLDEEQKSLNSYLQRVIKRYDQEFDMDTDNLDVLIERAIKIEKNLNGHMSEPKIKLPYEFSPEVKEKLIEAADLQDLSATQLIIKLIETKYRDVFGE